MKEHTQMIQSKCGRSHVLSHAATAPVILQLTFNPVGVSTFSPHLSLTAENSECCDCVHSVGHHILDSALKAVSDACANVSCPVLKQRCDWISAHQEEFSGVLAVELRPITDGYMVRKTKAKAKQTACLWQEG